MRRTLYTQIGIRRLKCFRAGCNNRVYASWQICADGRQFRPVCASCDVELNRIVLEWAGFPDAAEKLTAYTAKVLSNLRDTTSRRRDN